MAMAAPKRAERQDLIRQACRAGAPAELLSDTTLITQELMEKKLLPGHYINAVDNYYTMRDHLLAKVAFPQRTFSGYMPYRAIVRKMHGQDTGRFSDEEIRILRNEIWAAVKSRRKTGAGDCFCSHVRLRGQRTPR
ncbi:hypothetical protein EJ02DRAFT_419831 [Clathrospora elynae]|uniref:Uncharacterized protein n=1 Tax=Clathrospora elynae TaxID=706981 RepID=A0A6A5SYI8_9PLEO|nr:hypothetical protein EJ02DRAFT_419831 [Clathrospora elynae]